MIKTIITLSLLILTTCPSHAATDNHSKMSALVRRLSIAQKNSMKANSAEGSHDKGRAGLCAFVRITGNADSLLTANGCRLLAQEGDICIADIPLNRLNMLADAKEVKRIEANRGNTMDMDSVAIQLNAILIYEGRALPQPYTGRGVVMGIQDVGFDLTHPNFYDAAATGYRIKRIWDQIAHDTDGTEMYVGRAYETQDEILGHEHSYDGLKLLHGTLTAGIAAGSGYDTKFRGMAYESDLCLVSNAVTDDLEFIDEDDIYKYTYATDALGFKYIMDYAESVGKPCVISFSEGSNQDFRGDDVLYYEMLARLTGPGRIIVSSAGNTGHVRNYIKKPAGKPSAGAFLRIWGQSTLHFTMKSADDFGIRVVVYGSSNDTLSVNTADIKAAADSSMVIEKDVNGQPYTLDIMAYPSCYNAEETAYDIYLSGPNHIGMNSQISIEMTGTDAETEFYRGNGEIYDSNKNPQLCDGDNTHGINSPSSAPAVICVGATSYRTQYLNSKGELQIYDCGTDGEWAFYSSMGPTYDGRTKPDVLAPGTNILTSMSSYYMENNPSDDAGMVGTSQFNGRRYGWMSCSGTSMSSPIVGGIIALWLEARPDLTPQDIMGVFERTCPRYDDMEGTKDNRYGYGQIDAYRGLLDILGIEAIDGISQHHPESLRIWPGSDMTLNIESDTPLTQPVEVRIYTTDGRPVATATMPSGTTRFSERMDELTRGVYVVQANGKDKGATGSVLVRLQ